MASGVGASAPTRPQQERTFQHAQRRHHGSRCIIAVTRVLWFVTTATARDHRSYPSRSIRTVCDPARTLESRIGLMPTRPLSTKTSAPLGCDSIINDPTNLDPTRGGVSTRRELGPRASAALEELDADNRAARAP